MKLVCPDCGATIAGPDIDLASRMGVCRICGELVPITQLAPRIPGRNVPGQLVIVAPGHTSEPLEDEEAAAIDPTENESQALVVGPVDGLAIATEPPADLLWVEHEAEDALTIDIGPNEVARREGRRLLRFGAIWNIAIVAWYGMAIMFHLSWPFLLFPLLQVALGVSAIRDGTALLLHQGQIRIDDTRLLVARKALTAKSIASADITTIEAVQRPRPRAGAVFYDLEVHLEGRARQRVRLGLAFSSREAVLFACNRLRAGLKKYVRVRDYRG